MITNAGAPESMPFAYLTEERMAMRDTVRAFAMERVLPVANELDPEQGLIPESLIKQMADMGLFGILIPEEHGGLGLGLVEYCLITEELSRAWMSVGSIIARANGLLTEGFSEDHLAAILPMMARGEYMGAFALSEPGAGSDVASLRTRAELDGDDYVLHGQKMWCTFADQADFLVIVARTTPYDENDRHAGIRRFYVPKERGTFPGGITGTKVRKIGYHGWDTFELSIDGLRVPAHRMLRENVGKSQEALNRIQYLLTVARIHTAARSIALARAALEDSLKYAVEREQFGRRIGDFQAIRFKIGHMASQIAASRALMYEIAADADSGKAVGVDAAMVKYVASEMSEQVTSEAIQIHGGAGYTTDFPAERYWRDARLTKIFEGTSEIMLRIISNDLIPRPGR